MNTDSEKWFLPRKFQLDSADKLKAAAQSQSELAKKVNSPFTTLSPVEAEFMRAQRIEAHITKIINDVDPVTQLTLRRKLADALATQGRFAMAIEVEPSASKRAEFQSYLDATDKLCNCVHGGTWKNRPFKTTAHYVKREIFGQKPFVACSKCGSLAQTDIPPSLIKQRGLRQQTRDLARKRDVEGLQGMTSELLR